MGLALTGSFSKKPKWRLAAATGRGTTLAPNPSRGARAVQLPSWCFHTYLVAASPMSPLWACSPGDPGEGTREEYQARGRESKIPAPQPLSPPPRRRLLAAGESPSLPHTLPSPRGRASSTAACLRCGETLYTEVCKRDKPGRSLLGAFGWGWGGGGEGFVTHSTSTCLSSTRTCD